LAATLAETLGRRWVVAGAWITFDETKEAAYLPFRGRQVGGFAELALMEVTATHVAGTRRLYV
jgi:hypothetical protein